MIPAIFMVDIEVSHDADRSNALWRHAEYILPFIWLYIFFVLGSSLLRILTRQEALHSSSASHKTISLD
jgi:tryptophan-rich sensory protein